MEAGAARTALTANLKSSKFIMKSSVLSQGTTPLTMHAREISQAVTWKVDKEK